MEPHSGAEIGTGKDTTHLCLWKALFSSLFGWWDNKKNRSYPISGYALWLGPNEPPWIKRKVQLLDWKMGEHCEEERHKNLYLWQGFFTSHHEWWDYRNNKKNSRSPDFKHRDTGEALWLNPNYPPRVNLQIQFAWFKHGSRAPRAREVQVVVLVSLIGCPMAESIRAGPLKEEWIWGWRPTAGELRACIFLIPLAFWCILGRYKVLWWITTTDY